MKLKGEGVERYAESSMCRRQEEKGGARIVARNCDALSFISSRELSDREEVERGLIEVCIHNHGSWYNAPTRRRYITLNEKETEATIEGDEKHRGRIGRREREEPMVG